MIALARKRPIPAAKARPEAGRRRADDPEARATRMARAIAAAGGRKAVERSVREAWLRMPGAYWKSDLGHFDLAGLERQEAEVAGELAGLGGRKAVGRAAEKLRRRGCALAREIRAKRTAIDRRLKGRIRELVAAAAGGDWHAMARIVEAARCEPDVFPPGFAAAIGAGRRASSKGPPGPPRRLR